MPPTLPHSPSVSASDLSAARLIVQAAESPVAVTQSFSINRSVETQWADGGSVCEDSLKRADKSPSSTLQMMTCVYFTPNTCVFGFVLFAAPQRAYTIPQFTVLAPNFLTTQCIYFSCIVAAPLAGGANGRISACSSCSFYIERCRNRPSAFLPPGLQYVSMHTNVMF